MIEFNTPCRLNTQHLPPRSLWINHHGRVVTVARHPYNKDTRAQGHYYVCFEDNTFGHCGVAELEALSPRSSDQ